MVYTTHCRDMHSLSNWMRSIKEVNAGLAPYKSAKINAEPFIECCAEPFIALRAIHVGLAPNKSKIKNSWKCINALRLFFILSLLGLQLNQSIYPVIL